MKTREHDLETLRRDYKESANEEQRRLINEAGQRIRKESGKIRSMREALIREHRKGNVENVKDIHHFIKNRPEYKNE